MPKRKQPFLMMGEFPSDITRTAFRRMPKEQKRELMIGWFHANYEDPAERLPYESAEGGYQWIYGGPYDAAEEVREVFEGIVSEALIAEVVDEVQSDGLYEWAPTYRRDDYDDSDQPDEPDPFDELPDELGPSFGSANEVAARQEALKALQELERVLREPYSPGIGHNRPPDDFKGEGTDKENDVGSATKGLREELEKAEPKVNVAKRLLRWLGRGIVPTGNWVGRKVDVAVDEAVKNAVRVTLIASGLAENSHIQAAMQKAYDLVAHWLHLATSPF